MPGIRFHSLRFRDPIGSALWPNGGRTGWGGRAAPARASLGSLSGRGPLDRSALGALCLGRPPHAPGARDGLAQNQLGDNAKAIENQKRAIELVPKQLKKTRGTYEDHLSTYEAALAEQVKAPGDQPGR